MEKQTREAETFTGQFRDKSGTGLEPGSFIVNNEPNYEESATKRKGDYINKKKLSSIQQH